jgi:polyhydroxybutyrate depolymerase
VFAADRETGEFGGIERSWRIVRPGTPGPHPVIVALHGFADDVENFASATNIEAVGLARGFAVVIPEGTGERRSWNAGFCCGTALRQDVDDVGFILELVARIDGIDPNRVFLAGMSNGAILAYRIAAEEPERIAGVVAVAGAIGGTGRDGTPAWSIPSPRFAVPVMIVHGRADPYVLYEGGVSSVLGLPGRHNASVEEAIDFWTRVNDCAHRVILRDRMKPNFSVTRGRQCAATVVAWSLDGVGHVWPAEIDGRPFTQMVVDFFAELPPRAR